jgi:hypothetical protein
MHGRLCHTTAYRARLGARASERCRGGGVGCCCAADAAVADAVARDVPSSAPACTQSRPATARWRRYSTWQRAACVPGKDSPVLVSSESDNHIVVRLL